MNDATHTSLSGAHGTEIVTPCFERIYTVRFSNCDPAGIIFFPQYFIMFQNLVEDWFNDGMGISYTQMMQTRHVGLPTVQLECAFHAVSRMGEKLKFDLATKRIGNRSLTLQLSGACGGELRVDAIQVLVFTDQLRHSSIAIPNDVRAALERTRI